MKKIIIDTDPGIDDAIALLLALKNRDKLDIKLITTVFGNVDLEKTTKNTLNILNYTKTYDIPVAKGMSNAIVENNPINASEVHGLDGMGNFKFEKHNLTCMNIHAVSAMKEVLENNSDVTIVTLGALSNLALLIKMYPHLKSKISEIVMMGGSLSGGNTNTCSEFNIYLDPHAAKIVFDSGLKLTLFGLDVTRSALLNISTFEDVKDKNDNLRLCYELFKFYKSEGHKKGLMMHDSTTIAYLLDESLFEFSYKFIDVATEGVAKGTLVADYYTIRNKDKKPNIKYAINIDSKKFENFMNFELKK